MPRPGRIYLALDVNYFDDPDVVELSDLAQLLDLRAMALIKRLQADGRLTHKQVRRLAPVDTVGDIGAIVAELIASGIWLDKGDELERRGWLDWNDTAEMIEAMSRGGKRGNHLRWHVRRHQPDLECQFCTDEGLVPSPPDRPPESGLSLHNTDKDVDAHTNAVGGDRDKLGEFFRFGENYAHKPEATFTTQLAAKNPNPDETSAAWDGRRSVLESVAP